MYVFRTITLIVSLACVLICACDGGYEQPAIQPCGDSILDVGEVCDDGNLVSGDGCGSDCLSDETCGNGITDVAAGETCDDGNTLTESCAYGLTGCTVCDATCQSITVCPSGYTSGGEAGCKDIDECATSNGGCDPLTVCRNTLSSRTCGACPSGYTGDGETGCTDIDECASNNGGCDALTVCTNTSGSRTCGACPSGYTGDGETGCTDIDECASNNGGCDPLTVCTNTPGSRTCSACPSGYSGDGETGCTDIDECASSNGGCDPLTVCTNTPGSRTCGACPSGYSGDGETGCTDIDECASNNGGCDVNATCTNTPGSFACTCNTYYVGDGFTCDHDECTAGIHDCDPNAFCTNLPGSFSCTCNDGFSEDARGVCIQNALWNRSFSDHTYSSGETRTYGVAADSQGNIIVAGIFNRLVDFGGGDLDSHDTNGDRWLNGDIFVAKYDPDGQHLWSHAFGYSQRQMATSVAVGPDDSVVVVGNARGDVDFGEGTNTNGGGLDIFIAKFDSDGYHMWSGLYGDSEHQLVADVAVDRWGSIFLTGHFFGSLSFGGVAVVSNGGSICSGFVVDPGLGCKYGDVFIAKLASNGVQSWLNSYGDGHDQHGTSVAVDDFGNIVFTGGFAGNINFGGSTFSPSDPWNIRDDDVFIASLTSLGSHRWSQSFGTPNHSRRQVGTAVAFDINRNVILFGETDGSIGFGGGD